MSYNDEHRMMKTNEQNGNEKTAVMSVHQMFEKLKVAHQLWNKRQFQWKAP
jgi:hypothetical protein